MTRAPVAQLVLRSHQHPHSTAVYTTTKSTTSTNTPICYITQVLSIFMLPIDITKNAFEKRVLHEFQDLVDKDLIVNSIYLHHLITHVGTSAGLNPLVSPMFKRLRLSLFGLGRSRFRTNLAISRCPLQRWHNRFQLLLVIREKQLKDMLKGHPTFDASTSFRMHCCRVTLTYLLTAISQPPSRYFTES